jgi:hypothetical protein
MARSNGPRRHPRVREAAPPRYAPEAPVELTGVILDSDVMIEILRGRAAVNAAAAALQQAGVPTSCTPISCAEAFAGIRAGEEAPTQVFFEARGEVVLDKGVGRQAGEYLALSARSHGVEIADALVAAAAVRSGSRLRTLNRKHYPMADLRFYEPPSRGHREGQTGRRMAAHYCAFND